jgi:alpha-glucosidase
MRRFIRLATALVIGWALLWGAMGSQLVTIHAAGNDNTVEWDGLFHAQSPLYYAPLEPTAADAVTVTLRTYKNDITSANIKYYDAGVMNTLWIPLTYSGDDATGTFSFWQGTIPASGAKKYYRLQVNDGTDTDWVGRYGVTDNEEVYGDFFVFPDFKMPEWSKHAIYYQIFPDRFYDGDPLNNIQFTSSVRVSPTNGVCPTGSYLYGGYCAFTHTNWSELPTQPPRGEDFFGGDLAGINAKISPYLKGTLGVNALYLNPIFQSPSNHKYDTQDYEIVDPHFGTNTDLQNLIANAHNSVGPGNYRMSVMLDGVFNHSSDWHKWMDRQGLYPTDGAFESQTSIWYNRYKFNTWPNAYCGWYGFDSLPKLDFAVAGLRDEFYRNSDSIMLRYLKPPYSIDGWRYDVANEVSSITNGCDGTDNHAIWQEMRTYVKATNPEALMLGEYWQNGNSWILGANEWDTLMNYNAFNTPTTKWINCVEVHGENPGCLDASSFAGWVNGARNDYPQNVQWTLMSSLSTHDTSRFLWRAGGSIDKMKLATLFQMTWVGAPSIYYGDEVGLSGDNDPDNRRTFDWNTNNWNMGLLNYTQALIAARKQYSFLRTGTAKMLIGGVNNANNTVSFGRWDANGWALVGMNNSDNPQSITLNAYDVSAPNGTIFTDAITGTPYTVTNGQIILNNVPARSGVLLIGSSVVIPTPTPTATATATQIPAQPDTIGLYNAGVWQLRNSNTTGPADIVSSFGGDPSDLAVVGDWNSDGVDTIGVYRGVSGAFLLSNTNVAPSVTYSFIFGNPGDTPFSGRWDNSVTHDGVGVYRNSNGILYLKNQLTTGFDDYFMIFGNPGDQGIGGDWDGNGYASIGIYRSSNQRWYLNNDNVSGIQYSEIDFDWNISTNRPVVGDWDANGSTTVGYYDANGVFVLHSTNATAGSDTVFAYGAGGTPPQPVAGKWSGTVRAPSTAGVISGGSLNITNGNSDSTD